MTRTMVRGARHAPRPPSRRAARPRGGGAPAAFPPGPPTAAERIARARLSASLAAWAFEGDELAMEDWDPLHWAYVLGGGLFPLIAREAGTPEARLSALCGRLEGVPDVLAAARGRLVGTADRPVSRLHAEKAIE